MFVKAKQSGELLGDDGAPWAPMGVVASAEKIQRAYHQANRLGLEGLMIVSGAGNVVRGNKLREQNIATGVSDVVGRLATIQNTLILSATLQQRRVPNRVFIASSMGFSDPTIGKIEPYNVEAEIDAYEDEQVVLVAGGTGEDGKTTDNAILHYAGLHAATYPSNEIVVLKGTKRDGVYTEDPKINASAERYAVISAEEMLKDYERFSVVDRPCLESIVETGIGMRVYQDDKHDLPTALASNGDGVGTLIIPRGESILADQLAH
jgi:uridylate kinase